MNMNAKIENFRGYGIRYANAAFYVFRMGENIHPLLFCKAERGYFFTSDPLTVEDVIAEKHKTLRDAKNAILRAETKGLEIAL